MNCEVLLHVARNLKRHLHSQVAISERKCSFKIRHAFEHRLDHVIPYNSFKTVVASGCHRAFVIGSSDNRVLRVSKIRSKFHYIVIPKQPLIKNSSNGKTLEQNRIQQ